MAPKYLNGVSIIEGQAFNQTLRLQIFPDPLSLPHAQGTMARGVAEVGEQAGVLSLHQPCGGPALCARDGGEGEIPCLDADAGEVHRLSGGFLLPDGQSFPPASRSATDVWRGAGG